MAILEQIWDMQQRNLYRAQANTKKNILTDDENYHGTQYIKSFFGICSCWYLILKKINLQKPQIWPKMAISLF